MYCKVTTDSACVWIIKLSPVSYGSSHMTQFEFLGHFIVLKTVTLSICVHKRNTTSNLRRIIHCTQRCIVYYKITV